MTKIKVIASFIKNAKHVIDVGSDHAYLAIELLQNKKAIHVVNVEKNKEPLKNGIANLKKYKLLDKTQNILNNGLSGLNKILEDKFDYCVVAGMGSKTIIDILKNNDLCIKNFILQTNKNPYLLRKFLAANKYKIKSEYYIQEAKYFYPIFICKKSFFLRKQLLSSLYFGKKNSILNMHEYKKYLEHELAFINNKMNLHMSSDNQKIKKMITKKLRAIRNDN